MICKVLQLKNKKIVNIMLASNYIFIRISLKMNVTYSQKDFFVRCKRDYDVIMILNPNKN